MFEIGTAREFGCYSEAISLVDNEFIYSKGRSISLAQRFWRAYGEPNAANIYCAVSQERVIGVVVAQCFELDLDKKQPVTGAMLGGVVTHHDFRNQGVASQLLLSLDKALIADFLVLWTGIPDFYRRIGWQDGDRGLFGRFEPNQLLQNHQTHKVMLVPPSMENIINLGQLRAQPQPIFQDDGRYQNIPLPAEKVMLGKVVTQADELEAFAVIGIQNKTSYIYELVGALSAQRSLVIFLKKAFSSVFFNADSLSEENMVNLGAVDIKPGPYMLFKRRSIIIPNYVLENLYIPYMNRI